MPTPEDQGPGVLDSAQQALESTTKVVADGATSAASAITGGVKGLFGWNK